MYLYIRKCLMGKRIFLTEEQVEQINEGLKVKVKANFPVDPQKVKYIAKYLDSSFKRGHMHGIGDDGFPKSMPIVGMIGTDGNILRNMTDKQLFYLLQDRFKNLYDDKDIRDRLLIQILKDWFPRKITKDGLLTVNMI